MICKDVLDRLQSYVVGEVSEEERLSIQNHLASCEQCRKEEKITRWLLGALESDVIAEPSPLFVQLVLERVKERAVVLSARVMSALLVLSLVGLSVAGFFFREGLFRLAGELKGSVARVVSGLPLEVSLDQFLLTRIGFIYFISLGFAGLLLTVAIIWFVRYYWKPVVCRAK